MTLFRDLSILWSLFHILILFMLLYRPRYPRRKTFLLTGVTMGPLCLFAILGVVYYGAEFMGKIFILTITLPSLLFFWFMSKDKKGKFFFTFGLADTVALWIILVTNIADFYLGGQRYILMFIGRLILFPLAEWAAYRYLRKPYNELQESANGGWGLFAGMTALYYILLTISANFPVPVTKRPEDLPAFLLIMALMPMTYGTIFAAMYRQFLFHRKQQSERILLEQKNTLEAQLNSQQSVRKMKHDLKGHTATLSGLLTEGKTDEALAYLKGMELKMSAQTGQFCINPYINAVFVHYAGKLEEMGAEFRSDIQIGEELLPYMELCQILSNGLENACEALKGLDKENRTVSVQMKYNRNHLLIRIRNRCREELYVARGEIPATDKEGQEHGFGLATIKEAAECLDGDIFCYTDDGYFILDVVVSCQAFRGGKGTL